MRDLNQRIKIERAVDDLLGSRDTEVSGIAKAAQTAMKRNDYHEAQRLLEKAEGLHKPDRTLLQVICDSGEAASKAAARRLVEQNIVKIDGLPVRRHDEIVGADQVVTLRGKSI